MTTDTVNVIDSFRDTNYFLSNFSASNITMTFPALDNFTITMPTGEHAFHAGKVAVCSVWTKEQKIKWLEELAANANPNSAKYKGRSIPIDPAKWDAMSYRVMERVQFLKFTQNPVLAVALIATGDFQLIEGNTWGDKLWGTVNGEGKNQLGKILMALRSRFLSGELEAGI